MSSLLSNARQTGYDLQSEGPTPARVWGDQWLRVSEKVLKGLNHQLTNRVASLEAVAAICAEDEVPDREVVRALGEEVERLGKLLLLYRCMPAEPFAGAEPVRLQDIIPQVLELHGHHADLRNIEVHVSGDDGVLPLLVRPSALLRCLLVVLESGAGNALRSGKDGPLTLEYGGDEREVRIVFESPQPPGQLLFTGEGSIVHAVKSALAHAHVIVGAAVLRGEEGERIRYEVHLPTLPEARRREREGEGVAL
jgi:hypothetical protein